MTIKERKRERERERERCENETALFAVTSEYGTLSAIYYKAE